MSVIINGDGCFFGGSPPGITEECCTEVGFYAERFNSSQLLPPTVETILNMDTVLWDFRGDFDLTNDWFLVPFEGRYTFNASADVITAISGFIEIRIYQNSTLRENRDIVAPYASTVHPGCGVVLWCQPGDQIQMRLVNWTSQNATVASCTNQFSGALVYDNS